MISSYLLSLALVVTSASATDAREAKALPSPPSLASPAPENAMPGETVSKPIGTQQFPRIAGAGGVYALPGVDMPAIDVVHRVLIDATKADTTATGINRHLDAAARAVNLYALAKVPKDKLEVTVVVHGKATPVVLSDASYRRHFGKPNPDAAVLAQLRQAGVEIYVCGQALSHQGHAVADVRDGVGVSLSAMTKLVDLQAAGFGLIP